MLTFCCAKTGRGSRPGTARMGSAGRSRGPIFEPHYDAVEKILQPEIYPSDYQIDNKTSAMQQAALELRYGVTTYDRIDSRKTQWFLPPLAIRFRDSAGRPRPGVPLEEIAPNYHGKQRETCRLCGECDVGCNYGFEEHAGPHVRQHGVGPGSGHPSARGSRVRRAGAALRPARLPFDVYAARGRRAG